ncbi:angiotensin-converting enzyme-like [Diadema setosum]|uniref:angiotensin-converting enzyme-like n=1 Tax=Diadema setosum TaxID=31175 RepID=UPI003B3A3017
MAVARYRSLLLAAVLAIFVSGSMSVGVESRHREREGVPRERRDAQDDAVVFLAEYNTEAEVVFSSSAEASWVYYTNLTTENAQKQVEASLRSSAFSKKSAMTAKQFNDDLSTFPETMQRELRFIGDIGVSALDNDTVEEYNNIMAEMNSIYSKGQVCRPEDQTECLFLDPGLDEVMATSTDWDELVWAWKGFRDVVGVANKPLYARYVEIANEGAQANGYDDLGDSWRSDYGDDLETQVYDLYDAILPLYKELHAYVRRKLHGIYGDKVPLDGYLPANVLGDMWGRFWGNIYSRVVPFPDRPNVDVTDAMIEQGYNVSRMFRMADEFYTSMGLLPANDAFWVNSLFERPTDGRDVVCHASAWDFYNRRDFRIKMCTEMNMDNFLTIHHELGHIQYFMQYKDQPVAFRDGANGAFHEAIGEVMAQSVATPKHLEAVGLFEGADDGDEVTETDINFLLKMSLTTIATIPFSLALEQWRWDVFAGDVDVNSGMERWWQLKKDMIGVEAPVTRTEEDFDPGAMYHIIISYPFIGYYIRTVIQFQFYKSLCEEAGHTGPLYKCDFYNSQEAGTKLANMLSMGKSQPWPEAMEALTGQREMSADAILEYFEPLMEWLQTTNQENGDKVGWENSSSRLVPTSQLGLLLLAFIAFFLR